MILYDKLFPLVETLGFIFLIISFLFIAHTQSKVETRASHNFFYHYSLLCAH